MSSNSNVQQNLTQILEQLQLKRDLESESNDLLLNSQENLLKVGLLLKENLMLQGKDVAQLERMIETKRTAFEKERESRIEINNINKEAEKALIEANKLQEDINVKLKTQQEAYNNLKLSVWAGAGVGALNALGSTITTVFKVGKIFIESFIKVLAKVGGTALSVGKQLLLLPWNIVKSFISAAANASGSNELRESIEKVRGAFGSFNNATSAAVLKIATLGANMNNLALSSLGFYGKMLTPHLSLMRVWGTFPAMIKDISETLDAMGPSLNNVIDQFADVDNAGKMIAMQKGLGLAKEEFKGLADYTYANGKKIIDAEYEIGNLSLQMGDKFGISSKKISKDVGLMLKDLNNFGSLTEKQMVGAATQFQRLGVEISKVTGMMDKFDQFEDAAEASSKLSQAFGLQLDSMKMQQAQDPAERQQLIADAMVRAGKSTEGYGRQSLKLLGSLTGVDAATAKTLYSTKNLGKSYNDVKEGVEEASKKELTQEQVLNRLAEAIERVYQSGNQLKDGFFKTFLHGLELGIQRTPAFVGMMANIRQGLQQTLFAGIGTGRSITKTMGLDSMFTDIGNFFSPKSMKKFWGEGVGGVIKSLFDPKSTSQQMDAALDRLINLFSGKFGELQSKIYPTLKKLGLVFGKIGERILKYLGEGIGNAFKNGAILLDNKGLAQKVGEQIEKSPWALFLSGVWKGLKSAFVSIFDGLSYIGPVIFDKLVKALTWTFKAIEYFLSSKERKDQLKKATGGSFLGIGDKKEAKTGQEAIFDQAAARLQKGIQDVWNDPTVKSSLKEAISGAWSGIKNVLKGAWDFVFPYIKNFLAANLVVKMASGALAGATGGTARYVMQMGGFSNAFPGLASGLNNLRLALSGSVGPMMGPLAGLSGGMRSLLGGLGKGFSVFTKPMSMMGDALKMPFSIVTSGFTKLTGALGMSTGPMGTLAATLAGPVGLVAGALLGAAALVKVGQAMIDFSKRRQAISENLKLNEDVLDSRGAATTAAFLQAITLGLMSDETATEIGVAVNNMWNGVKDWLNDLIPGFGDVIGSFFDGPMTMFEGLADMLQGIFDPDSDHGAHILSGGLKLIMSLVKPIASVLDMFFKTIVSIVNKLNPFGNIDYGKGISGSIDELIKNVDSATNVYDTEKQDQDKRNNKGLLNTELSQLNKLLEKQSSSTFNSSSSTFKNQKDTYDKMIEILKKSSDPKNIEKLDVMTKAREKLIVDQEKNKITKEHGDILKKEAERKEAEERRAKGRAAARAEGVAIPLTEEEKQGGSPQQTISSNIDSATKATNYAKETIKETKDAANTSIAATSEVAANVGKVAVNLAGSHNQMMEGINSIKATIQNIQIQVAVAVQLSVADLEIAILNQNTSLIRKAVNVIEGNMGDNGLKVNPEKLPPGTGGRIADKTFGVGK